MKRFCFLFIVLVNYLFVMNSCTLKDRMVNNTLSLAIEPAAVEYLKRSATQEFKAIVRNAKNEMLDINVNWSFSNDNIGELSANVGKSTKLMANSSNDGIGELCAEYGGVIRSISIKVSNAILLYENGKYGSLVDVGALSNCLYSTPPGFIQLVTRYDDGPCLELSTMLGTSYYTGFFIKFMNSVNLTSNNYLKFNAKICVGSNEAAADIYVNNILQRKLTFDQMSWTEYAIKLDTTSIAEVREAFKIGFTGGDGPKSYILRLNNIRFEEENTI